ncbi:hypothetical protein [Streptomyces sp. UH6]|uniref:hypothetical protein n=1 Tax=Streptomyces sp. UH6 TaxID=2748379 RepID=UPI0015D4C57D|nr:hypothetical protein [Streptomyces sp. UH6]NYV73003.1 hypothetical protein [Streptomyces sp. UH6]
MDDGAVARLAQLGLVDASRPERVVALDPRLAARQLRAQERAAIQQSLDRMNSIEQMEGLAERYDLQRVYGDVPSEYLPSKDGMNSRIGQIMAAATSELLTLQPGKPGTRDPEVQRAGVEKARAFLARGLRVRTIYNAVTLHHQQTTEYVEAMLADGGRVRVGSALPPRMVIVDRQHLFLDNHVLEGEPNSGWHVVDKAAVAWAVSVYEMAWSACTPWERAQRAVRDAVTTARQRAILRQLEAGDLVEAVGTALHMSTRVVNKELQALRTALSLPSTFALMAWWGGSAERGLP